jgi:hypothetical protein
MSNRTAKFASAIFVGLLAGVSHTTLANGAVRAPNDCLSGPKGQTPAGGHWYYHIDRATKRHCWYLAEETGRLSRVAPRGPAPLTRPVSPQQQAVTLSFADARAELPLPQMRFEAPNRNDAWIPTKPSETTIAENSQVSQVQDTNTPRSVVASRWPEQFSTAVAVNPTSTKADPAQGVEPASRPLSPPSLSAADQSAATEPSSQPPTYFAQLQLAALLGGLALAGIAGGAVFNFGNSRGSRPRKAQTRPGTIWEPTDDHSIRLSAQPRAYIQTRRSNFARDLDQARRNDRIGEFFSQLSKEAAT